MAPINGRAAQEKHVRAQIRKWNRSIQNSILRLGPHRVGGQLMYSLVVSAQCIEDNNFIFVFNSPEMVVCPLSCLIALSGQAS